MILAARIVQNRGQELINYLVNHDLFDKRYKSVRDSGDLVFAVTKRFELEDVTFSEVEAGFFPTAIRNITLREALKDKLSQSTLDGLKTAFDQVGTIAILEIDLEYREYDKLIGETLLKINPAIKTVLRKDGEHTGVYRNQKMVCLAGVDTREASFVENGVRMLVDVETVYFSARLSNERMRIANQVQKGEDVLIMFSGSGVQGFTIARHSEANSITCVEINPDGHKYAQRITKLNKFENVELYCGDVRDIVPKLHKTFDRVTMNLPKVAYEFLDVAIKALKQNGTLHYYDFLHEDDFDLAKQRVSVEAKKQGRSVEFGEFYTVGSQGVKTYRLCLDCTII